MATGRVAAVFLEDDHLLGWCRSTTAFGNEGRAAHQMVSWIQGFGPHVVLIEDAQSGARKGRQSRRVTEALAGVCAEANCLDLRVRRTQGHANKYLEAEALAKRFPEAKSILPKKPPIWLPEPRNMSYFEALSLIVAMEKASL